MDTDVISVEFAKRHSHLNGAKSLIHSPFGSIREAIFTFKYFQEYHSFTIRGEFLYRKNSPI